MQDMVIIGLIIFTVGATMFAVKPDREIEASHVKQAEEKCANNNGFKKFNFENNKITCNNGAVFVIDGKQNW